MDGREATGGAGRPAGRALVTGASSGIGRALVQQLVHRGWHVVAVARRAEALASLAETSSGAAGRCVAQPLDVTDHDGLRAAVDDAARELGGLDVAVANAGVGIPGKLEDTSLQDLERVFAVNVFAAVDTLVLALPHVRRSPRPLLAAVSSLAGHRGGPESGAYNASKAALKSLLETLRMELAGGDVRVLDVRPGFVRTPMTARNDFPMPFLVGPDAAARRIARAIERRRSHLAFPRRAGLVVGLLRHMPDRLFDALAARLTRRLGRSSSRDPGGS